MDGKYLALKIIIYGDTEACGHKLHKEELVSLDRYMKRCKHGQYRSARAAELYDEVSKAGNSALATDLEKELATIVSDAKQLLRKLERIQASRKQNVNKPGLARMEA